MMLDIPFPLETVPAEQAETALSELIEDCRGVAPVLLGDADIFSIEWAEVVDEFENPADILAEARALDVEAWFANRIPADVIPAPSGSRRLVNGVYRVAALPVDAVLLPVRLLKWPFSKERPHFLSRAPFAPDGEESGDDYLVDMLRAQLAQLEKAGEGSDEDLAEIRAVIDEIAADGTDGIFPDPVAYVTPRHGGEVAAGLLEASEPWECAAWLQHGSYAICAPKPVFVAHCRWLWNTHGGRIITASTDHVGFQMERPIDSPEAAVEVLKRFAALGATEINGDHNGTDGASLVGALRLWVWWD